MLGNGALALNGGTIVSEDGFSHTIGNAVTIGGNLTFGPGVIFSNSVSLGSATRTLTLNGDLKFSGSVSTGGISKTGNGLLEFANAASRLQPSPSLGKRANRWQRQESPDERSAQYEQWNNADDSQEHS